MRGTFHSGPAILPGTRLVYPVVIFGMLAALFIGLMVHRV